MMSNNHVCPVESSGFLDSGIRKIFQNPEKILKPYISEGMRVLDMGCGPGFFTLPMCKLVQSSGEVVAADLQEGMLLKLKNKVYQTDFKERINFIKVQEDKTSLSGHFDFILVFYMFHEVTDKKKFLKELKNHLTDEGKILISEPLFHVSKTNFQNYLKLIKDLEFKIVENPQILFSRSIIIQNMKKT